MEEETHYIVKIKCFNCGIKKRIEIQKGTRVDDNKCPNCGCRSIERTEELFEW